MGPDDEPTELSEPFVKSLEYLMLAQAQECVWQRAVMGMLVMDGLSFVLTVPRQLQEWSHCEARSQGM